MQIRNVSARLIHLNLGATGGVISIAPLSTVDLKDEHADAAKLVLEGPMKALVDDGSLVIDGKVTVERTEPLSGAPAVPAALAGDPVGVTHSAVLPRDAEPEHGHSGHSQGSGFIGKRK